MSEFCNNSLTYYPMSRISPYFPEDTGIIMGVSGFLNALMSIVTVVWIKTKEREAQNINDENEEDNSSAKSVIFPAFVRILWISAFANVIASLVTATFPISPITSNPLLPALLYALMYAIQHYVIEGIAILLMQKGCGYYAEFNSFRLTLIWTIASFCIMSFIYLVNEVIGVIFEILLDFALFLFYFALWKAPQESLYRRPAAINYGKIWAIYRACACFINFLFFFEATDDPATCVYIIQRLIFFSIFQPLVCYWTLLMDSRWWQGSDINLQIGELSEDLRSPLAGQEFSMNTAQSLADTMDHIRVKGHVKMCNFACIKMDFRSPLGAGSFSKVYKGTYHKKPIAIKLIYTHDLTQEVIKRVAAEASILSSIKHVNVVNIIGVTVLPPSVCLLLELCYFGSLSDVIRGYGFDWNKNQRNPLRLSKIDMLYLALGCSKGLAAVHSYSSTICHRDIKSFNFLVDHNFIVKLADLELGSDTLQKITNSTKKLDRASLVDEKVNVEELLPNWLAPEVIVNKKFQQASDIYALGTVMWEIISLQLPYENINNNSEIIKLIVSGNKLPIPPNHKSSEIAILIDSCWNIDPDQRPSAKYIASRLESMLKDMISKIVGPTPKTNFDFNSIYQFVSSVTSKTGSRKNSDNSHITTYNTLQNRISNYSQSYNVQNKSNENNSIFTNFFNKITNLFGKKIPETNNDFDGLDDSDLESNYTSTAMTSLWKSRPYYQPDGYINPRYNNIEIPPNILEILTEFSEQEYWKLLENSNEAWVAVTADHPHIVLKATPKWFDLFDIPPAFTSGGFHMLTLLSLISPKYESSFFDSSYSNLYVRNACQQNIFLEWRVNTAKAFLDSIRYGEQYHGLLNLHVNCNRNRTNCSSSYNSVGSGVSSNANSSRFSMTQDSLSVGLSGRIKGHNMMCMTHAYPIFINVEDENENSENDLSFQRNTEGSEEYGNEVSNTESTLPSPPNISKPKKNSFTLTGLKKKNSFSSTSTSNPLVNENKDTNPLTPSSSSFSSTFMNNLNNFFDRSSSITSDSSRHNSFASKFSLPNDKSFNAKSQPVSYYLIHFCELLEENSTDTISTRHSISQFNSFVSKYNTSNTVDSDASDWSEKITQAIGRFWTSAKPEEETEKHFQLKTLNRSMSTA